MNRFALFLAVLCSFNAYAQQGGAVERKDVDAKTKLESVVSGYVLELNGKYKLRVSELTFKPGGYVGEHHHLAPGMRVVTAGELTFVHGDKTTIYKAGDAFYEPWNVTPAAPDVSSVHEQPGGAGIVNVPDPPAGPNACGAADASNAHGSVRTAAAAHVPAATVVTDEASGATSLRARPEFVPVSITYVGVPGAFFASRPPATIGVDPSTVPSCALRN